MRKIQAAIHADDDFHYQKLGLTRNKVEIWEDGMRTDGSKGTYEWWYFDSSYPDGTKLIIFFFSKSPIEVDGPIKPMSTMELTLPDGRKFEEQVNATIEESFYNKDKCDIRIGDCHMDGDLKQYNIVFKGKTMSATVSLTNTVPAWRSQCGPILFGDNEEYYFNWLPATPEGNAIANVIYPGGNLHLEGSGYHDHNWGNIDDAFDGELIRLPFFDEGAHVLVNGQQTLALREPGGQGEGTVIQSPRGAEIAIDDREPRVADGGVYADNAHLSLYFYQRRRRLGAAGRGLRTGRTGPSSSSAV